MNYVLVTLLSASLFLGGCAANNEKQNAGSQDESSTKTAEQSETNQNTEAAKKESTDNSIMDSPQAPDDTSLTEVGQTFEDQDGSITLKAISNYDETTTIGDIELTVSDVKAMNYSPSPDLVDFFHGYSDNETQFNYVKLRVTVKNTSDQAVNFAPVSVLETSNEKKGFEDDFYLENLYGDYAPGEEKTGQLGFVLNKTDVEKLESITVHTSDVFDEKKESLTKGKSISIPF
ncbi:DUF4352 domain-containing protein [Pseudalkalibacillus hwajinpoensis]|uniref:DUF4352 domain-containing protein n=1 Tax=Guptibacillus hwajinpoensis TaxID=208199 RepID=A0A4U1MNM3_9BACL|nr:DUF4352 domain-containing protein [Pseudalkalibacillus hwajinpoensis]TKD72346.1 DUF4352 domain-containing protein [Pseudalkalibacillus hwajinpoensis]